MREQLEAIDTSVVDELAVITTDQEMLRDRIAKMEARRSQVSEAVFARVHADYEAQIDELDRRAEPLRAKARETYAEFAQIVAQIRSAAEDARLAGEEMAFRHDLGEFDDDEFETRVGEIRERQEGLESDLEHAEEIRTRFVQAFGSEEALSSPRPTASAPPPPAPATPVTGEIVVKPSDGEGAEDQASAAQDEEGGEVEAEGAPVEDGDDGGATGLLATARLVVVNGDGAESEAHSLRLGTTTIGRSPRNDICLQVPSVSRHHAKIVFTERGFVIYDLGSENGVFVNGDRVTNRVLIDGDRVEFGPGPSPYVFRGP